MTNDVNLYMTLAATSLAGLGMVTAAGLSGWRSWLTLKREELHGHQAIGAPAADAGVPTAASRIEIADLKERLRKLEAIAAGVDL
ncbi:hypothetical protein P1X14_16030 [Sphingomonas sp. AOB5]|uniref:hypothetical protein n=1 Tax=Sphingomonas sp. AOB5 TaxID=3034017 RepID=UPI0023F934B9|nr:hypothetical protein [Sphingomonas sp. AOB5]MDF7776767.1 hypothetical protein [Sphingomonas sp. AOB5]